MRPKARHDNVVVQEIMDELVVYDQQRHRAHNLNPTAAWVWRHCDGQTTVEEMAALLENELNLPADEKLVWLALDRLEGAHLLQEYPTRPKGWAGVSRRDVLRRLAWAGVGALALPVVRSIVAPTPAMAQTPPPGDGPTPQPKPQCVLSPPRVTNVVLTAAPLPPGKVTGAAFAPPCPALKVPDLPPPGGGTVVKVHVTKEFNLANVLAQAIEARLVNANPVSDDLLDSAVVRVPPGGPLAKIGDALDADIEFDICCVSGEVRGRLGGSGESSAELAIEYGIFGDNFGDCDADCVDP